jgi:hypothetical protein
MRHTHMKTVHLPTPVTRIGDVTPTRGRRPAWRMRRSLWGANEEQITMVVAAATTVLTRKWSNKSEATSVTISVPI